MLYAAAARHALRFAFCALRFKGGKPQIVRKVQLEAEVARLERVRAVWLDTRRTLRIERGLVEEEIRRAEARSAQWGRAEATVATHPHEPFCAEVAASLGSEQFSPMTGRAEAGAAVRRLVHATQSDAAFQRQRRRAVVGRYRGLDLVVQAHPSFAAELSLALPDGARLDTVSAETDSGLWQSVGHLVSAIPGMIARLEQRVAQGQERIATIDRELERLEMWDGQAHYDTASAELRTIAAAFAAEEQAATPEPTAVPATADSDLATSMLALAQADAAHEVGSGVLAVIPPAPASLAWMAAQPMPLEPVVHPETPTPVRAATPQRPIAPMPASGETFQQLSLFG